MKSFRFSGEHPNKSQIPQKNPAAECAIMGLEYQGIINILKSQKPKRKVIGIFNGLEVYRYEDEDIAPDNANVRKAIRCWEATPAHILFASDFSTIDWNNWEW